MFNWFKGKFLHKEYHISYIHYEGLCVKGYTCSDCGYIHYKRRKR